MAESQSAEIISIRDVSYTHWNQTEPSLKHISLSLRKGTLSVLVGPGGSGKSTLCCLFNGEIPHLMGGQFEGDVYVNGVNTRDLEVKGLSQQVGHVFQDPESMFATLYVEDEIAFGPENLKIEVDEIRKRVDDLLETTMLTSRRRNLVWNLSGGQIQKLGLAVILAMNPQVIILDEPTANLDPVATRSVHELILELRRNGMTVLLVTRTLDEFLASADQLLVLSDGCLAASGTPQEVLRDHGMEMMEDLGIWLPESAEIGISLQKSGLWKSAEIPITVPDTIRMLEESRLLCKRIDGFPLSEQPAGSGATLIEAKHLVYAYGRGAAALDDVSLEIHAGEMLAIVGRNGAGKSTLAKLLVGLLKPQKGELILFGKSAKQWNVQELSNRIALVFQNPEHQFLTDSVTDEIGYSLISRGMGDPAERAKIIQETITMLGLNGMESIHPFALSAGMKRRLGVATMLVCNPEVLIVDEPTYGQDKEMTHTLMERMEEIRKRGIAVVMVTHDMRLVQEYAHRVVVMSEGKVHYDGDPSRLFEQTEILQSSNLRQTMLQELLNELEHRGTVINGRIRNTQELIQCLTGANHVN
jgi:energy-coupling factor transport system ATP-binding protein